MHKKREFDEAVRILIVLAGLFFTVMQYGCKDSSNPPPQQAVSSNTPSVTSSQHVSWVTAYYAGWMQNCDNQVTLRPDQIDFTALTHVIHFAVVPNPDGSINDSVNCVNAENAAALVNAAHSAGKKVLLTVGGWETEAGFLGAVSDANRKNFISGLINLMTSRGYDGLDVDWEPISSTSADEYTVFINELRQAIDAVNPRPLLVAAVLWESSVFGKLQDKFDQINVMTYELAGPWLSWEVWHSAALYNGGYQLKDTGAPLPSSDALIQEFLAAGVPPGKLGLGIEFYGYMWAGGSGTSTGGVTQPLQISTTVPLDDSITYSDIMTTYYQPGYYRWDSAAQVPYLSIDLAGATGDKFISYEDETSVKIKMDYIKQKGLGGLMIFELGGGWRASAPVHDNLLQAVKNNN